MEMKHFDALEMTDGSRYEIGGTYKGQEVVDIITNEIGSTFIVTPNFQHHINLADIRYWTNIVS